MMMMMAIIIMMTMTITIWMMLTILETKGYLQSSCCMKQGFKQVLLSVPHTGSRLGHIDDADYDDGKDDDNHHDDADDDDDQD